MTEIKVRPAVSPDFVILSSIKHSVQTGVVWQMERIHEEGKESATFYETRLPRLIWVDYPNSVENLYEKCKTFSSVLVACVEDVPIGYIALLVDVNGQSTWIKDLAVHERWRRRGFASSLIKAASEWSVEREIHRLMLEMSSKNHPAISLAKMLGFEYCGYNDYYYGKNDIGLFFTRHLR